MIVSHKPFTFMQSESDKLEENDNVKVSNEKKGKSLTGHDRLLSLTWDIAC